jgi:hypothetical protein
MEKAIELLGPVWAGLVIRDAQSELFGEVFSHAGVSLGLCSTLETKLSVARVELEALVNDEVTRHGSNSACGR